MKKVYPDRQNSIRMETVPHKKIPPKWDFNRLFQRQTSKSLVQNEGLFDSILSVSTSAAHSSFSVGTIPTKDRPKMELFDPVQIAIGMGEFFIFKGFRSER